MDHVFQSVVVRNARLGMGYRGFAQRQDRGPVCFSLKKLVRRIPSNIRSSAADEGAPESEASTSGKMGSISTGGRAPQPLPVKGMKLERVERLGEEAWAGVAAVDRGEDTGIWRTALLVGGDVAILAAFVAIGRANHGQTLDIGSISSTALPFLIGWLGAGALLGGYGPAATGGKPGPAALAALKTWAVGVSVGIALRTISRGYIPDKSFVIVTFVITLVLMLGWRTGLAALTPDQDASAAAQMGQRKDKKGNPLEFLQLLASLTKRW